MMGGLESLGQVVQQHPGKVVLGYGLVIVGGLILHAVMGRRRGRAPTTHGSARWATKREVRRLGLEAPRGFVLGHRWGRYLIHAGEAHALLIGPTRSWKGRAHLIPSLLIHQPGEPDLPSVIVTDPKQGENYAVTQAWREQFSRVLAFAPMAHRSEVWHWARCNMLDTVRLGTPKEFGDADTIAQSLVAPAKMERENSTSLHFRELAALFLTTVILHVLYAWTRKSLAGCWEFMTRHGDVGAILRLIRNTKHHSAGVHQAIAQMSQAMANITGDRELSSIWSTAIRPLILYNDPMVAAATDTSDFDFDDFQYGPEPISLYLIAPSPRSLVRLHPLFRVILDIGMTRMTEHPVRSAHRRVDVIADELPAYGYVRAIDQGISDMAGYDMRAFLVAQDLDQLWETYGERTPIWGNCSVKLFHAPANDLTAKRISEHFLGEQTVENPVAQQSPVIGHRRSVSLQHTGRRLLTTDELMGLNPRQLMIWYQNFQGEDRTYPILAYKPDYRTDPAFAGRWAEVTP
jgi:type IV secretion system protein VirD4